MNTLSTEDVYALRGATYPLFDRIRSHFKGAPVPFPIAREDFLDALTWLEETRPDAGDELPRLATAAEALTAKTAANNPDLSSEALRLAWRYLARTVWAPKTITPEHIAGLEAAGFTGRQIAAIAQWSAVHSLLYRRDCGAKAIADWQAAEERPLDDGLFAFTGTPSSKDIADFDTVYQNRVGAWHPWVSYIDDGYDWKGNFDAARAPRKTYRVTASDRELAKILACMEDDIFDPAKAPAADGLARAGRELAALLTSVQNGCGYCTTAHAKGYVAFGGAPSDTIAIVEHGDEAPLDDPIRSLVEAVSMLNRKPRAFDRQAIAKLVSAGVGELAALDLVHATAYFNFANRVIIATGGYKIE